MTTKDKKQKQEPSQEFVERTKLQKQDKELAEFKKKMKMELLAYERETQRMFHENQMSYHRIKRADIRREMQEKAQMYQYRNKR